MIKVEDNKCNKNNNSNKDKGEMVEWSKTPASGAGLKRGGQYPQ